MKTVYADKFPFSDAGRLEVSTVASTYLHGELEDKAMFDLVTQGGLTHELGLEPGVHPIRVCFDFGDARECIAFVWENEIGQRIAVIVSPTDIPAIQYAQEKYSEKPLMI